MRLQPIINRLLIIWTWQVIGCYALSNTWQIPPEPYVLYVIDAYLLPAGHTRHPYTKVKLRFIVSPHGGTLIIVIIIGSVIERITENMSGICKPSSDDRKTVLSCRDTFLFQSSLCILKHNITIRWHTRAFIMSPVRSWWFDVHHCFRGNYPGV